MKKNALQYICPRSIIAKFEDSGWKQQNMIVGEKAVDVDERSGFTHILRFPSCI